MEKQIQKIKIIKIIILVIILAILSISVKIIFNKNKQIKNEQITKEETIKNIPELWKEADINEINWYNYGGKKVNTPKLMGDMVAIEFSKEVQGNRWANAITKDGSMWVWIPRFAYKITQMYHSNAPGEIEIAFLDMQNEFLNKEDTGKIVTNPAEVTYENGKQEQWLLHPAFNSNAEIGGGFGTENGVSGIWIAKFEASGEKNIDETISKIQIKPCQKSLRKTTINEIYMASKRETYKESENLKSHLIKNSEWGATIYLAHSKYGINKEKIERNDNEEFYTGGSKEKEKIYEENKKQSSTYNAYGVYDLNGGSYEAVAAYINTGGDCLEKNGGIEEGNIYGNTRKENSTSTEYKTVYKVEKQNGKENQQKDYNLAKEKMGDGIYETSSIYISNNGSWFGSYAQYPSTSYPFFIRGGNYTLEYDGKEISSSFCFSSSTGETYYDVGFRTVLVE